MKHSKNELDVDYIGGTGPLTNEEAKAISQFIKASKERNKPKQKSSKSTGPNKKAYA